ncbi:MAG: hypothetical protein ACI4QL_01100 [Candidatus Fimimonas sp.]
MLKPKYIENILAVTKERCGDMECDVVCECGAKHFVAYKNVIARTAEEAAYQAACNQFCEKNARIRFGAENGVCYLYGMKGLFGDEIAEKFEYKKLDETAIVKVKCAECGKEYVLFDSRFHGYNAVIAERESTYDGVTYDFAPVSWAKDKEGVATISVRILNDDCLEDFFENAYETDEETYSNSFCWITIKAVNTKTKAKKTLIDMETQ